MSHLKIQKISLKNKNVNAIITIYNILYKTNYQIASEALCQT